MPQEELLKRAKLRAMQLLLHMDRTEAELCRRLQQDGYPEDIVAGALSYVKSYHYIDDERYVRQYLNCLGDKKSKRMIEQKLQQKGIERELLELVWEQEEDSLVPEEEQIRTLAQKRLKGKTIADERELRRLYGFFARRGYRTSDIRNVLKEFVE